MKIAIVGCGAIGGYVGTRLALAGETVTFLVRGATLEAVRAPIEDDPHCPLGAPAKNGNALVLARDARARSRNVRGEARARALHDAGKTLAAALDVDAQQLRAEPSADAQKAKVMNVRVGPQAAREPCGGVVKPLPRQRQHLVGVGQSARGRAQFSASRLLIAPPAGQRAAGERTDVEQKLAAHRHCHFGGGGWGRCATIGSEIDQCDVGLVPDRGDERN